MNLRVTLRQLRGRRRIVYTMRGIRNVYLVPLSDGTRRLYFCDGLNQIIATPLESEIQDIKLISLPDLPVHDLQPTDPAGHAPHVPDGADEAPRTWRQSRPQ